MPEPHRLMVLADDETYTLADGCTLIEVDLEDYDDWEVREAVQQMQLTGQTEYTSQPSLVTFKLVGRFY